MEESKFKDIVFKFLLNKWKIKEWVIFVAIMAAVRFLGLISLQLTIIIILAVAISKFYYAYKNATENDTRLWIIKSWKWSIGQWILFLIALATACFLSLLPICISFFILFFVLIIKLYDRSIPILRCIGRPGFSVGFIMLFGVAMAVIAVATSVVEGMKVKSQSHYFVEIMLMLFVVLVIIKICKLVALKSVAARSALPVFLLIITGGMAAYLPIISLLIGDIDLLDGVLFDDETLDKTIEATNVASETENSALATISDTSVELFDTVDTESITSISNFALSPTSFNFSLTDEMTAISTPSGFEIQGADGHTLLTVDNKAGIVQDHLGKQIASIQGNRLVDMNTGDTIVWHDETTGVYRDGLSQILNTENYGQGTFQSIKDVYGNGIDIINGELFDAKTHERIGSIHKV